MSVSFDAVATWVDSIRRAVAHTTAPGAHLPVTLIQYDATLELRITVPAHLVPAVVPSIHAGARATGAPERAPAAARAALTAMPLPEHLLVRRYAGAPHDVSMTRCP